MHFVACGTDRICQSDPVHGPPPGLPSATKLPALRGKIAEIKDDGLTMTTTQGDSATVKVSTETRFRREQKDAHLDDFKVGDTVTIVGEQGADGTWTARLVATGPDTSNGDRGDTIKLTDFKPGDHISVIGGVKDGVVLLTECRKAPDLSAPPPPPPPPF